MDKRANWLNYRLYATNGVIASIYDECVDPDTGEVVDDFEALIAEALAKSDEAKDDAINEIKTRLKNIEARKAEIERLKKETDHDEEMIATLKESLADVLGGGKYKSTIGSVTYRHSTALEIADEPALTAWAQDRGLDIFLPPKPPVVSKKAVADLIGDGLEVPYSEIVERVSVIVR